MTTQSVRASSDLTMPTDNNPSDDPNKVVWMSDTNLTPPGKTITFTNNTDHTVYPFLASANNAAQCSSDLGSGSIYDPKDPWNEDYRGYIGYTGQDGNNYLGLPSGQTVTVPVPLVFWDAGRIYIASDSANLTPNATFGQSDPPINPYQYYQLNQDGTETLRLHQKSGTLTPSGLDALIMWYHGNVASGPNNDAPAQLLEFTIRDPWQQKLNNTLDPAILGPLINYDVSYVDTIYLPVAMEATDVSDGDSKAAFGWIGASQTESKFQQVFENFTASGSSNGLGLYFGTDEQGNSRGYTQYNLPSDVESAAGIKLPSGAQAIGDSPFQDKRSSYDQYKYLLTSGGTGGIEADINAVPHDPQTLAVTLNPGPGGPSGAEQQTLIQEALTQPGTMNLIASDPSVNALIPEGTQLTSYTVFQNNSTGTATLNQPTKLVSGTGYSVSFKRPIADYVTSALLNLWYSWTKYYVDNHQVANQTYAGSISSGRVLTFTDTVSANALVPGMQVTGSGIPTDSDGSFCTIADITTQDDQSIVSITLSELATNTSSGNYQFIAPQPILGIDTEFDGNKVQTFSLKFGDEDAAIAKSFSQAVYQAMSAMSTIPLDPKDKTPPPLPIRILYNVIGCNVGQIPHIGQDLSPRDGRIAGEITDKIKSVLRGVPDFLKYPESTGLWYPAPDIKTGDCNFNVYNLDPFVWFVHKQLELSGYGFSVDDDVADVGANGATNLHISIGGLNELPNPKQWSPDNPFGG